MLCFLFFFRYWFVCSLIVPFHSIESIPLTIHKISLNSLNISTQHLGKARIQPLLIPSPSYSPSRSLLHSPNYPLAANQHQLVITCHRLSLPSTLQNRGSPALLSSAPLRPLNNPPALAANPCSGQPVFLK
ncbi:hypothetical protein K457DRAFT_162641 [Linnemannia elongata AG-77]|uniref:Uncharacterized protein n=1 Tax=Linnemannia elongata AG-77 TaxID=1314771 RepID=A0A197KIJ4_9FUNG|nr:hypothetical protein K457DRAFT_162641 [Linnemannia elongata AG-77]